MEFPLSSPQRNRRQPQGQLVLCLVLLSLCRMVDSSCAPYPVGLRVGNVTLSNGQAIRGVDLSVGSPSQKMAFLPQVPLNSTFLYGTDGYCNDFTSGWADEGCTSFRGGAYDSSASTTEAAGDEDGSNIDSSGTYPDTTKILDSFTLNSNKTLLEFPLGIALSDWGSQGYFPQMGLGLGSNSTLLTALLANGSIASRSWGWFWGLNGPTTSSQLDGSLVLGGYDRAKVTGKQFVQSMAAPTSACSTRMIVTITDLILEFTNGTSASILTDGKSAASASSAFTACLDPAYPSLMTLALDPYWSNFESLTSTSATGRSFGLNYYDMRYGADSSLYTGDLTIVFSTGLSIRVSNSQFVGPDVTFDKQTGALIANETEPDIAINSLQSGNADDMIQLGRHFFTAAYLMATYDTEEFSLWSANPTANEDLVAIDTAGNEVDAFCDSSSTSSATSSNKTLASGGSGSSASASANASASASAIASASVPIGAIVGGIVGGIAVLVLVAVGAFCLIRRRRRKEPEQLSIAMPPEKSELGDTGVRGTIPHELASDASTGTQTRFELA